MARNATASGAEPPCRRGIAARNFTAYPEMPDINALVDYGVKMEDSLFQNPEAQSSAGNP